MSLAKKLRPLRHRIEYPIFLFISFVARSLPRPAALAMGRLLGDLMRMVPGPARIARKNLAIAFPEMEEEQVKKTLKEHFRHLGVNGIEMLRLGCLPTDAAELSTLFTFEGLDGLKKVYAEKRGVLILTGHVGGWEMGTYFMSRLGFETDVIAKAMRNGFVDDKIRALRECNGGGVLYAKKGARRILRSLGKGHAVCVLPDQHMRPSQAVIVDFFGKPAYTTPIITEMAMKKGVPIVPVFCFRKPDGTYRVEMQEPIRL